MHPKAIYLTLHGYRAYELANTLYPRIKLGAAAKEPTLVCKWDGWIIGRASGLESYTELPYFPFSTKEWDQLPQELLAAFCAGEGMDDAP